MYLQTLKSSPFFTKIKRNSPKKMYQYCGNTVHDKVTSRFFLYINEFNMIRCKPLSVFGKIWNRTLHFALDGWSNEFWDRGSLREVHIHIL